jgi:hypothetical protein
MNVSYAYACHIRKGKISHPRRDNNGLPFDDKALTKIAKIEPEDDDVDFGTLLGALFDLKDGNLRHEHTNQRNVSAGHYSDTRTATGSNGAKYTSQRSAEPGQLKSTKTAVGPNGGVYTDRRAVSNGQVTNTRTVTPAPPQP